MSRTHDETFYLWWLKDQYGQIVRTGIESEMIEMLVDSVIPESSTWGIDRNMSDMQNYIDEHFPGKYDFFYQAIDIKIDEEKDTAEVSS